MHTIYYARIGYAHWSDSHDSPDSHDSHDYPSDSSATAMFRLFPLESLIAGNKQQKQVASGFIKVEGVCLL
jgi:hypothetical protein